MQKHCKPAYKMELYMKVNKKTIISVIIVNMLYCAADCGFCFIPDIHIRCFCKTVRILQWLWVQALCIASLSIFILLIWVPHLEQMDHLLFMPIISSKPELLSIISSKPELLTSCVSLHVSYNGNDNDRLPVELSSVGKDFSIT